MATKLEAGGGQDLSGPATSGGTFFFAASLINNIVDIMNIGVEGAGNHIGFKHTCILSEVQKKRKNYRYSINAQFNNYTTCASISFHVSVWTFTIHFGRKFRHIHTVLHL